MTFAFQENEHHQSFIRGYREKTIPTVAQLLKYEITSHAQGLVQKLPAQTKVNVHSQCEQRQRKRERERSDMLFIIET
jgi:hypothetical protein